MMEDLKKQVNDILLKMQSGAMCIGEAANGLLAVHPKTDDILKVVNDCRLTNGGSEYARGYTDALNRVVKGIKGIPQPLSFFKGKFFIREDFNVEIFEAIIKNNRFCNSLYQKGNCFSSQEEAKEFSEKVKLAFLTKNNVITIQ